MNQCKAQTGKVCIGTSGRIYPHWRGSFYPESLRQHEWLDYYKNRFRSTETNNTSYQLSQLDTWKT